MRPPWCRSNRLSTQSLLPLVERTPSIISRPNQAVAHKERAASVSLNHFHSLRVAVRRIPMESRHSHETPKYDAKITIRNLGALRKLLKAPKSNN